jgi:hypothetical protein
MSSGAASASELVKAGVARLCADFTKLVAPLGFVRTNSRSREWTAQIGGHICSIHFHRSGSTYGAPLNNSVSIRAHFSVKSSEGTPVLDAQLTSDNLRDEMGNGYHLRFNALSWSTYDRCLADLMRVTRDKGMPWFERHGA